MKKSVINLVSICAVLAAPLTAWPAASESVLSLQAHWAQANYQAEGKQRKAAFKELVEEANELVKEEPGSADAHIWAGIVFSTYAGEVSMFKAGKQVKRARAELEQAIGIAPDAMNGAAFTSLGALLYQIPGFMGGDDEKAEELLKKGLEFNAEGIDPNYFYGLFLLEQKRYDEARAMLIKASEAPPRAGRPTADEGRREEIRIALSELEKALS